MFKTAPLESSFMLTAMFGFLFSAYFLDHPVFRDWAWACLIIFVIMFAASIVSMSNMPLEPDKIDKLAIHQKDHYKKKPSKPKGKKTAKTTK